jgi:hypothetical protein
MNYNIITIGDLVFKLGTIYRDILNKNIFLEIVNPYFNKYEECKDFSYDVLNSLFNSVNLNNFCMFDSTLERLYKENKLKANNHLEYLQYINLIFKKN